MQFNIIGENIHIISPKVKEGIANKDARFFQDLAVSQVEGGAVALDLNIGPQKKAGHEIMPWLVNVVQEVVDVPLSFDTTNLAAIEEGCKVAKTQPIINSTSADPERLERVTPLAKKYNTRLIALTMGTGMIPVGADERVNIALETLIPKAMELEIPVEDLILDPLALTVVGCQEYAPECVEAVRMLKFSWDPPPAVSVGLSNTSNRVPPKMRPLINQTYLIMLMAAGLDTAIADPLDQGVLETIRVIEERDESTAPNRLKLRLFDATVDMGSLEPEDVDFDDPEQVALYKTVQILRNDVIYTDSYLEL